MFGIPTMSNYAWIITKDYIPEEDAPTGGYLNAPGLIGPSDATAEQISALQAGQGYRFRIKDDDGETYYDGRIVLAADIDPGEVLHKLFPANYGQPERWLCTSIPEEGFGPLNDFGAPNAGAVSILYFDANGRLGEL
jgi:hypothetical protein